MLLIEHDNNDPNNPNNWGTKPEDDTQDIMDDYMNTQEQEERDDLVEYLVVRSDGSWEYSGPEDCPTHCAFPEDADIKVHQQKIGNFLVTIQEITDVKETI